jgi:hypothetical protein
MPSAKKLQDFLQQTDLSQSDQQQLAKSIANIKKKRAQKRTARAATLPFEIHVHSWYYLSDRIDRTKEDIENMYRIPRHISHTVVSQPRVSKITHSKYDYGARSIGLYHYYKYHIDATIRCPDFQSIYNVCRIFTNGAVCRENNYSGSYNQIFLNYPEQRIQNHLTFAKQRLQIEGTENEIRQKLWKKFNPDEKTRIWVTFKDDIFYDNEDVNRNNLVHGFLSILGRFVIENPKQIDGFRVDAKTGQFIS